MGSSLGDDEMEGGFEASLDFDDDGGAPDFSDGDGKSVRIISVHSLIGFFMIFGWVGLATYQQLHFPVVQACVISFLAGLCALFGSAYLLYFITKLQSSGTVFDCNQAVGKTAVVYHRISLGGVGKILVEVHGVTREVNAKSAQSTIASFKTVRIIGVVDKETVLVEEVK